MKNYLHNRVKYDRLLDLLLCADHKDIIEIFCLIIFSAASNEDNKNRNLQVDKFVGHISELKWLQLLHGIVDSDPTIEYNEKGTNSRII